MSDRNAAERPPSFFANSRNDKSLSSRSSRIRCPMVFTSSAYSVNSPPVNLHGAYPLGGLLAFALKPRPDPLPFSRCASHSEPGCFCSHAPRAQGPGTPRVSLQPCSCGPAPGYLRSSGASSLASTWPAHSTLRSRARSIHGGRRQAGRGRRCRADPALQDASDA